MKNLKLNYAVNNITNCNKCRNLVLSRSRVVDGYGDFNASIMLVGLAPGRKGADQTGIPFTRDRSGLLLQEALIASGFSLERDPSNETPNLKEVYVTNIVKCNPRDDGGRNRNPSKDEVTNCEEHLKKEIEMINPSAIVLLGKICAETMLNQKIMRLNEVHNTEIIFNNRVYVPFLHPSYSIRGMYPRDRYIEEFKTLRRFIYAQKE